MPGRIPIALVSTPWPLFNRPSIQLGALKAYVEREVPGVRVDDHYLYLAVAQGLGYGRYAAISERTWLSEAPYAALLYPERREAIARLWQRQGVGLRPGDRPDFEDTCRRLEQVSEHILDRIDWKAYRLVGLSICFGQLTSALYFIARIRRRAPGLQVVAGGSACSGEMGRSLLRVFPGIDWVVSGEGEIPLAALVKGLARGNGLEERPAGLFSRESVESGREAGCTQVPNLDRLPEPDFSGYFARLGQSDPGARFLPELPMEISRGCWWRKAQGERPGRGCAFCNLNLQWQGYRTKSRERAVRELASLTERHQALSVCFADNLLPPKGAGALFGDVAHLKRDFRLFAEIRATTSPEDLTAMGRAGMREVQVGVEALSSRLLKKLNKGVTAIQNLEIMKHCEAPGSPALAGNLILNFPGSDRCDVEETLHSLKFALPFRPLKGVPFWLGYGSPVWQETCLYGLKRVGNHPFYAHLFPRQVCRGLRLIIQGYQGGLRRQHRLWQPVRHELDSWQRSYEALHEGPGCDPILSFHDGGSFLILRQRLHGAPDMTHRLKGTSRRIYLFCQRNRSLGRILDRFPGFGEDQVRPFLAMMVDKRLMFREGERYLSLAVPIRGLGRDG